MNREKTRSEMTADNHEEMERRRKTLATLVDLYEGAAESSCYGPDRAEHLLREQSDRDELRAIGVDERVIERIFGDAESKPETGRNVPDIAPAPSRRARPDSEGGTFLVRVEARFEAAHYLRSYRGFSEPLHGHSYRIEAELGLRDGALDEDELAVDFVEARKQLESIAARLDYGCINEIAPFDRLNPTAENVARWFCDELQKSMAGSGAMVTETRLFEGPVNSVTYRPARSVT